MSHHQCQSCGLPLDRDPEGGGTEQDGIRSTVYCSYCYRQGAFVQPDWTAQQMQDYATKKLQQYGLPALLAGMLTKGIPKLKRWTDKAG